MGTVWEVTPVTQLLSMRLRIGVLGLEQTYQVTEVDSSP